MGHLLEDPALDASGSFARIGRDSVGAHTHIGYDSGQTLRRRDVHEQSTTDESCIAHNRPAAPGVSGHGRIHIVRNRGQLLSSHSPDAVRPQCSTLQG
jgi:hypothetical protein